MTSYLKRWRTARPRVGGAAASEEWEELSSRLSEASDREEEDAVVVASAASAASPPAKAEASPPEPTSEEEDDTHPFALLRLRIRPASVAFWGRWWATCVLLVTTGFLTGGIVARGDGAPAVRLTGSAAADDAGSRVLRGEYKGVPYECVPVVAAAAEVAPQVPAAAVAPPVPPPPPPSPPMPPLLAPLRAADVAEGAAQLAEWLRCCGRSAVDDAASSAVPLARMAGAAAHRAAQAALRALDAAGRGVATGSTAPAQRASAGIVDAMDKLRKGMREGLAARLPQRMPFEALRAHAASRFF